MGIAQQKLSNFMGDHLAVSQFTGSADTFLNIGARVFDAAMTAGSTTVTSASSDFSSSSVGDLAYVRGAGPAGADLVTHIAARLGSTSFELGTAASSTVSGVEFRWGPDNTEAFQSANDAISIVKKHGGKILVPKGIYLTSGTIYIDSHVRFEGECYVSTSVLGDTTVEPSSFVLCVRPVPVFATRGEPCYSPAICKLGISGTPASGSKGIYGLTVWDITVEDCFFEDFGDQALHLEVYDAAPTFSVTATIRHNFAQNCCRVRTGRVAYVGVFDIGPTDCFVYDNNINASMDGEGIITGKIAALAMRGASAFVGPNQCGHSEVGVYVSPKCFHTVFISTRADNNQGPGWIIDSADNGYVSCRSFANSQASDGTYDAFVVNFGGNTFDLCRVGYNGAGAGPLYYRVRNGFTDATDLPNQNNGYGFNFIAEGSFTGERYAFTGTQKANPILYSTGFDPIGRPTVRAQADVSIKDVGVAGGADLACGLVFDRVNAAADEKLWRIRANYGIGFSQLLFSVLDDAFVGETAYLAVHRTGMAVTLIEALSLLRASAGLRVIGQTDLQGGTIVAPNGVLGLSGIIQVRNAAGTGFSSITLSGGLITAFAP